ncbi:MAG: exodeoxyribonuclease VII large subunit [Betaproteobacteria bacterium]|nr:exodeoxyribonuclease VII large subunit [Betaproteobacteria bacterium]
MPSETGIFAPEGAPLLSVSELNRLARETLEGRFPLSWVGGEISNLRRPASGHLYFALKDENAQVDCVMFRGRAQLLPFRLQDGLRVEARALVTLYEARGSFQLNIEALRHAGVGALYEAFARLRARLEGEGLFAAERRLPLPRFPRRIGVVTSLQAAALRDVLAALARRAPQVPVTIYPTLVQGEGAAANIAGAIRGADARAECDLLIVARGGGSIEDLWAFNEEIVARAIDACAIPVISGIGHESDTTIADLAADCRAATPTAAAELASAGWHEATGELRRLASILRTLMQRRLQERMQRADLLARRLLHPGERLGRLRAETAHIAARLHAALRRRLHEGGQSVRQLHLRIVRHRPETRHARQVVNSLAARLQGATSVGLARHASRLDHLASSLAHLSPQSVLRRGYSLVRKSDGSIVRGSAHLAVGESVQLTFGEGGADARVTHKRDA